jgi:intracellular multiplication protein IcmP
MDSQKKDSNVAGVFLLGIFVIIMLATILGAPFKSIIAKSNFYTLYFMNFVLHSSDISGTISNLRQVKSINDFSWEDIWTLTWFTGSYLRWIIIPPFLIWLVAMWRKDPIFKYRRQMNIMSLLEKNARIFFSVRPLVGENLLSEKSYKGNWRPFINPFNYALENNLFSMEGKSVKEVKKYLATLFKKRVNMDERLVGDYENPTLDEARAEELFKRQLGERIWEHDRRPETKKDIWGMLMKMPKHKRALATVLLCHYVAERDLKKEGDALLEQFADSYYTEKLKKKKKKKVWSVDALNVEGVDDKLREILKTYDFDMVIIPFLFHAWSHTLLISLFSQVKTITSADFIWVKPVDRELWYVLNNVGRKTYGSEGAGAFAHFQVEVGLGRPLTSPDVDSAVAGLRNTLATEGWLQRTDEA